MYAIGQGLGLLAFGHTTYAFGHGAVGQQHEFLYQFVGVFRLLEIASCGLAGFIDVEVQFLAVKLHGTVVEAGLAQRLGQTVEHHQFGSIIALVAFGAGCRGWFACSLFHAVALQYFLHFFISKAAVALDDGMHQSPFLHVCLFVHVEYHAVGQFLLIGAQRADEVAEPLGQHGDGAVNKIHAGGPFHGFFVDDGAFGHIVRHVGDMHAHFPQTVVQRSYRQGIIKVLGILGVDGECGDISEILPLLIVLFGDFARNLVGGFLHLLRIFVGQSVLSQNGVHLGIVVACGSKHIDDFAHDVLVFRCGPLGDFHQHLVAVFPSFELVLGYDDVVDEDGAV